MLLAAGATLQVAGAAWAMGGCHPGETLTAERTDSGCCAAKSSDRWTELGGDCCETRYLDDEEPAASSPASSQVPPAQAAWLPVQRTVLGLAPAVRTDEGWRRSYELPPPLAPPTENVVLLN